MSDEDVNGRLLRILRSQFFREHGNYLLILDPDFANDYNLIANLGAIIESSGQRYLEAVARIQRKVASEIVHVHRAVRGGGGGQLAPDHVQRLDVVRAIGRFDLEHGGLVEHECNLVSGNVGMQHVAEFIQG